MCTGAAELHPETLGRRMNADGFACVDVGGRGRKDGAVSGSVEKVDLRIGPTRVHSSDFPVTVGRST